jgi:hypothetical protein
MPAEVDIVVEVAHYSSTLAKMVEDNSQIEDLDYMHSVAEEPA